MANAETEKCVCIRELKWKDLAARIPPPANLKSVAKA
jgi:hypothetical protein